MTKHLNILHVPDRLAQPHRPNSLLRSEPRSRVKGANRQQPGLNPRKTLRSKVKTTVFNPHTNASAAASNPTGSTLSP